MNEWILIGLIIVVMVIIFTPPKRKRKRDETKPHKVVNIKEIMESIFTDVNYEPIKGIPYEKIEATEMINMGDRFFSEGYISAKYKDIPFEQSNVRIQEEHEYTDSDGHTHREWITIFKGRWMIFEFNKKFKGNVQVVQKGFTSAILQDYAYDYEEKKYKKTNKVKMESDEFNKRFSVIAQNEQEAFYILTPSLMEKFQKLDDQNKGNLMFCFVDDKLHVALDDGKNSFDLINLFREKDEEKAKSRILEDMRAITQFIDELNLENDLFK